MARQNRMLGGTRSKPVITVEPVVLKPDIASKNASAKPLIPFTSASR